jgi:YggT family protein
MIYSVYTVLSILFNLLELAIIIDCISSWIPQAQGNKIISTIHEFIYPILEPIKKLQDRLIPGLPIDFSPIVALVVIDFIRNHII